MERQQLLLIRSRFHHHEKQFPIYDKDLNKQIKKRRVRRGKIKFFCMKSKRLLSSEGRDEQSRVARILEVEYVAGGIESDINIRMQRQIEFRILRAVNDRLKTCMALINIKNFNHCCYFYSCLAIKIFPFFFIILPLNLETCNQYFRC